MNSSSDADDSDDVLKFVDSKNWYSIWVEDPGIHRESDILDGILHQISPAEFVPVLSEKRNTLKRFYVTKCEKAIKKISQQGFECFCLNDPKTPLRLKVIHNDPPDKKINPFEVLHFALKLRFNKVTNELNLTDLVQDFCLLDRIYFPLWYPGNQKVVKLLIKALSLTSQVHILNLSNNFLRSITEFNIPEVFPCLHTLNLSNNLLESIANLEMLMGRNKITTLWLDGNDLCLSYVSEVHYLDSVKIIFPAITKLDGKILRFDGIPLIQRNFVIDRDCMSLVNKFMEMYFFLFDSEERDLLPDMYTHKAMLTISCQQPTGTNFHKKSRNLFENPKSSTTNIFVGTRNLYGCLDSLPRTEHDPLSFTVDVTSHSRQMTVVNITGVFKIPSSSLAQDEPFFEFMRTFILVQVDDTYCYKIANDMLNISSQLTARANNAFTVTLTVKDKLNLNIPDPSILGTEVKEGMINILISITELPYLDAQMCLEKKKWNFRDALLDAIALIQRN